MTSAQTPTPEPRAELVSVALDVWHAACHAEATNLEAATAMVAAVLPSLTPADVPAWQAERDELASLIAAISRVWVHGTFEGSAWLRYYDEGRKS